MVTNDPMAREVQGPPRRRSVGRAPDYDVVVVGAGTAGLVIALALGRKAGLRVAVVDHPPALRLETQEQLCPRSCQVLERLEAWRAFLVEHHVRAIARRSGGAAERATNTYIYDPEQIGWTVDRFWLNDLLRREVRRHGIIVEPQLVLVGFDEARGLLVQRDDGATIYVTSAFVVDASGLNSCYARLRGAHRRIIDPLVASTVTFQRPTPPPDSTPTEAWSQGWWFVDQRPRGQTLVSCVTDPEAIDALGLASLNLWWAQLDQTDRVRRDIADAWACSTPIVHAASCERLDRFAGPDWLAVDDAAFALPPLGRPGVARAIIAGDRAAATVGAHLEGHQQALEQYAHDLEAECSKYIATLTEYYVHERDPWSEKTFWRRRRSLFEPHSSKADVDGFAPLRRSG